MNNKLQYLIAGRTKVIEREDEQGYPILEICTSELTPFGAKSVDNLVSLTTFSTMMLCIHLLMQAANPKPEMFILALFAILVSYPVSLNFWRSLFRSNITIIMTPETIQFDGEKGKMELSRMQKHNFTLRNHDKALKEKRDHELETKQAQRRNRVIVKKPYYSESVHVVLKHMGQRHDLIEVYDHKNAHDVTAALTLCDNHLNNHLNIGNDGKMHKDDDWEDSPGGL